MAKKKIDYQQALVKPFSDLKKAAIGIILSLIPIVNFIVQGYVVEMIRQTAKGKDKLPEWKNWGTKFIEGLELLVIEFIYLLIPIVVMILTLAKSAGTLLQLTQPNTSMYTTLLSGQFALITAIVGVLFVIFGYILSGAIVNFSTHQKFGAAFRFKEIWKKVGRGFYFKHWFIAGVIYFILGAIGNAVSTVSPMLGIIVAVILGWEAMIFYYTIIAKAYTE